MQGSNFKKYERKCMILVRYLTPPCGVLYGITPWSAKSAKLHPQKASCSRFSLVIHCPCAPCGLTPIVSEAAGMPIIVRPIFSQPIRAQQRQATQKHVDN